MQKDEGDIKELRDMIGLGELVRAEEIVRANYPKVPIEKLLKEEKKVVRISRVIESLKSFPYLRNLQEIAQLTGQPIFNEFVGLVRLEESPYVHLELKDLTQSPFLVWARIFNGQIFPYDPDHGIKKLIATPKPIQKHAFGLIKQTLWESILVQNEMTRTSERGGAHFAHKEISRIMYEMEDFLADLVAVSENKMKKLSNWSVEQFILPFHKKRNLVLAGILNWRLRIDTLAIEGGENIPITFSRKDIKAMLRRYKPKNQQ